MLPTQFSLRRLRGTALLRYALCLGFISYGSMAAWQLLARPSQTGPDHAAVRVASAAPAAATDFGAAAADRHLFGIAAPAAATTAAVAVISDVQVVGVVAAQDDSASAILNIGGDEKVYAVGDRLSNGARLVAVESDRVILDRNGNRYSVALDIPQADMNSHFRLLSVSGAGVPDIDESPDTPAMPVRQAMNQLRQSILTHPRRKLDIRPQGLLPPP